MIEVRLTPEELATILGALSSELRYCQRNLDRAREEDAINRWADRCVQIGDAIRKLKGETCDPT